MQDAPQVFSEMQIKAAEHVVSQMNRRRMSLINSPLWAHETFGCVLPQPNTK